MPMVKVTLINSLIIFDCYRFARCQPSNIYLTLTSGKAETSLLWLLVVLSGRPIEYFDLIMSLSKILDKRANGPNCTRCYVRHSHCLTDV